MPVYKGRRFLGQTLVLKHPWGREQLMVVIEEDIKRRFEARPEVRKEIAGVTVEVVDFAGREPGNGRR